jgi:predicted CopG family antitoxin
MATKTISIDLEAYERLRRARLAPDESFSRVIKRARWRNELKTAAGLLGALEEAPPPDPAVLDRLVEIQRTDVAPEDPWHSG